LPTWKRNSRYRDKALRNSAEPFLDNLRAGKQFFKISRAQQAHVAEICKVARVRCEENKPWRKADQLAKCSLRQPVSKRHERVGIDGKPFVGRLHKEAAPATHALRGELALPINSPNMLNYRVAEDHVESRIREISVASIADDVGGPIRFVAVVVHIQDRHFRLHWEQRPVESSAAHVQNGCLAGDRKSFDKALHPPGAEHF